MPPAQRPIAFQTPKADVSQRQTPTVTASMTTRATITPNRMRTSAGKHASSRRRRQAPGSGNENAPRAELRHAGAFERGREDEDYLLEPPLASEPAGSFLKSAMQSGQQNRTISPL